jgi:hypothetical protein
MARQIEMDADGIACAQRELDRRLPTATVQWWSNKQAATRSSADFGVALAGGNRPTRRTSPHCVTPPAQDLERWAHDWIQKFSDLTGNPDGRMARQIAGWRVRNRGSRSTRRLLEVS